VVFLRAAAAHPDLAGLRADFARNLLEVMRVWARYASWEDCTTRPGRALVCGLAGISVSTYKACRRWWEARGFLGTVREGTTPWLHGAAVVADLEARNDAAVYVLAVPRQKQPIRPVTSVTPLTRPPTVTRRVTVNPPHEANGEPGKSNPERPGLRPVSAGQPAAGAAVALLKGPGQTLSDRHVAWIARRFTAAGWSGADLTWAVDHLPDGVQHRHRTAGVRHPGAWLRWRLRQWIRPDGTIWPSASQQRAAYAARLQTAAAENRIRAAAARSADVDTAAHAAVARALLAARVAGRGPVHWIQYPAGLDHRRRRNGRSRSGVVQPGRAPRAGARWVAPDDGAELFLEVCLYPEAPERNYALDEWTTIRESRIRNGAQP